MRLAADSAAFVAAQKVLLLQTATNAAVLTPHGAQSVATTDVTGAPETAQAERGSAESIAVLTNAKLAPSVSQVSLPKFHASMLPSVIDGKVGMGHGDLHGSVAASSQEGSNMLFPNGLQGCNSTVSTESSGQANSTVQKAIAAILHDEIVAPVSVRSCDIACGGNSFAQLASEEKHSEIEGCISACQLMPGIVQRPLVHAAKCPGIDVASSVSGVSVPQLCEIMAPGIPDSRVDGRQRKMHDTLARAPSVSDVLPEPASHCCVNAQSTTPSWQASTAFEDVAGAPAMHFTKAGDSGNAAQLSCNQTLSEIAAQQAAICQPIPGMTHWHEVASCASGSDDGNQGIIKSVMAAPCIQQVVEVPSPVASSVCASSTSMSMHMQNSTSKQLCQMVHTLPPTPLSQSAALDARGCFGVIFAPKNSEPTALQGQSSDRPGPTGTPGLTFTNAGTCVTASSVAGTTVEGQTPLGCTMALNLVSQLTCCLNKLSATASGSDYDGLLSSTSSASFCSTGCDKARVLARELSKLLSDHLRSVESPMVCDVGCRLGACASSSGAVSAAIDEMESIPDGASLGVRQAVTGDIAAFWQSSMASARSVAAAKSSEFHEGFPSTPQRPIEIATALQNQACVSSAQGSRIHSLPEESCYRSWNADVAQPNVLQVPLPSTLLGSCRSVASSVGSIQPVLLAANAVALQLVEAFVKGVSSTNGPIASARLTSSGSQGSVASLESAGTQDRVANIVIELHQLLSNELLHHSSARGAASTDADDISSLAETNVPMQKQIKECQAVLGSAVEGLLESAVPHQPASQKASSLAMSSEGSQHTFLSSRQLGGERLPGTKTSPVQRPMVDPDAPNQAKQLLMSLEVQPLQDLSCVLHDPTKDSRLGVPYRWPSDVGHFSPISASIVSTHTSSEVDSFTQQPLHSSMVVLDTSQQAKQWQAGIEKPSMQDSGCLARGQSSFGKPCHADQLQPMQPRLSSAGSAVTVSAHSSSAVAIFAQQALGQVCAVQTECAGQHICGSSSKPLDLPEQPQSQVQSVAEDFHSCCKHALSSVVTATTHSSSEARMFAEEASRSWIQCSPPALTAAPLSPKLVMPAMAADLPLHTSPTFDSGQQVSEPPEQESPLQNKDRVSSIASSSDVAEHEDNTVASGSATPAHQSASGSLLRTARATARSELTTRWKARNLLEGAAAILPRMASRTASISSVGNSSGSSAFRHRAAKELALEFSDAVMAPSPSSARAPRRNRTAVSLHPAWGA